MSLFTMGLVVLAVLVVIDTIVTIVLKKYKGCTGSCEQGRKECDCANK